VPRDCDAAYLGIGQTIALSPRGLRCLQMKRDTRPVENVTPPSPEDASQVDLHLHAGQERDQPLDELVRWFVDNGVTTLGLLDHSELYMMGDEALRAKHGQIIYPSSPEGLGDFYDEIDRMRSKYLAEASIYRALELPEWELLTIPGEMLVRADFLGCHMNTSCHDPSYRHYEDISCGEHLATRASQLLRVCEPNSQPAVLFHPFHRRIAELRTSIKTGELVGPEEVFTREDIDLFLDSVDTEGLFIDLNLGDIFQAAEYREISKQLGRTCRRLREGGLSFSLGSDYHRTPEEFRDPSPILSRLGIGIEDLGLVQTLSAK